MRHLLLMLLMVSALQADPYLSIANIENKGKSITLTDGSEWSVMYYGGLWKLFGWGWSEQKNTSHWTPGDTVEVQYPSSGNFTDFILVIHNIDNDENVLVYLVQPPSVHYQACLWVMDIDEKNSTLTLNDGSTWLKSHTDMYGALFQQKPPADKKWAIGDPISLIKGEGWLSSTSYFLWNHFTNEMPYVNKL